jgi:hypothetical protein
MLNLLELAIRTLGVAFTIILKEAVASSWIWGENLK